MRSDLHDIRERTWAFAVKYAEGDETAIQACQLLFGNWVARQISVDHHSKDNADLIWEFGRIAIVQGVGIAEDAFTQVVGEPA